MKTSDCVVWQTRHKLVDIATLVRYLKAHNITPESKGHIVEMCVEYVINLAKKEVEPVASMEEALGVLAAAGIYLGNDLNSITRHKYTAQLARGLAAESLNASQLEMSRSKLTGTPTNYKQPVTAPDTTNMSPEDRQQYWDDLVRAELTNQDDDFTSASAEELLKKLRAELLA